MLFLASLNSIETSCHFNSIQACDNDMEFHRNTNLNMMMFDVFSRKFEICHWYLKLLPICYQHFTSPMISIPTYTTPSPLHEKF